MTEAKPKRRFQFSIRELLLVTVIIGLSLGWWLDHRDLVDTPRPVMHYLGNTEAARSKSVKDHLGRFASG